MRSVFRAPAAHVRRGIADGMDAIGRASTAHHLATVTPTVSCALAVSAETARMPATPTIARTARTLPMVVNLDDCGRRIVETNVFQSADDVADGRVTRQP